MRAAGRLKENIEIYSNTITKDEYGQEREVMTLKTTTKAQLVHSGGNRELDNEEITHSYRKQFTVRYYVDIDDYDVIKWENKYYRVLDIEPNKEYQYKVINTEKIND